MTTFFEESPGVRSMARLTIFWMNCLSSLIVVTGCSYIIYQIMHQKDPSAGVITAITGFLLVPAVKAIYAIKNRNAPSDTDAPPAA